MKSKKIIVTFIIATIFLMYTIIPVHAANYPFTFTVSPQQVSAKPGDTITVDLGMADIDQSSDGINAIQGDISYNEEIFEKVEIVSSGSNWSVSLNQSSDSSLKGRFVISNMSNQKTSQVVARLKATIKSSVTASTATIELKDVFSSYGTTETEKANKTITINLTSSQSQNNGSTKNTTAKSSTNSENISTSSNLPKTGLSPWMGIGIVITLIGAVIGYIRYKKIY